MSTFLHYVHCKDALLDCSAPGGERCESLTWVDEIVPPFLQVVWVTGAIWHIYIEGILPKGPYPPCLRMANRALLAGYPRYVSGHRFIICYKIIACCLIRDWPSSKPMLTCHQQNSMNSCIECVSSKFGCSYSTK